jgi:hypothetical protein
MAPFTYAADSASIYQVALTGMAVPGTGGTFTSFSAPTTDRDVDQDTGRNPFWFIANTSDGNSGVYVYDAYYDEFADLVDTTMPSLTGGGNFASFSNLSSGVGVVGFLATDANGDQGVYAISDFPLTLIATPSTSLAAGITLGNIQNISVSGDSYGTPAGLIESATGIYDFIFGSAPVHSINYGSLTSFGPVSYKGAIAGSNLPGIYVDAGAFTADAGGVPGIYYGGPGSDTNFLALASIGGAIPNGTGRFTSFGNPIVTANEVAFTAHYTLTGSDDHQGIFVYGPYENFSQLGPSLYQIVATGQTAPNSHGATFTGFSDLADSSFDETFLASLSDGNEVLYIEMNEGISYSPGPQLLKIIETGDLLDGKTVASISLSPDASNYYESPTIRPNTENIGTGFEVSFTDGSEGVYYFDVNLPEPASLGLLVLLALQRLRRK